MRKILYSLVFIFISPILFAQQYEAKITSSQTTGFHKLEIPRSIQDIIGNDLSLIRIFDYQQQSIPFVERYQDTRIESQYKNLTLDTVITTDTMSMYILNNPEKEQINTLKLVITNTSTVKPYKIDGSIDQVSWYSVLSNAELADIESQTKTTSEQIIHFPLISYPYIRISMDDRKTKPIHILSFSKKYVKIQKASYDAINETHYSITHNQTTKQTHIFIQLKQKTIIDLIDLSIKKPNSYRRTATLSLMNQKTLKGFGNKHQATPVYSFKISSDEPSSIYTNQLFTDKLQISIDNLDNHPLEIDSIILYQKPLEIFAELEAQKNYVLQIDTGWTQPQYDLSEQDIPADSLIQEASLGSLIKINGTSGKQSNANGKLILWIGLILTVLIVFYFSIKLINESKKAKGN